MVVHRVYKNYVKITERHVKNIKNLSDIIVGSVVNPNNDIVFIVNKTHFVCKFSLMNLLKGGKRYNTHFLKTLEVASQLDSELSIIAEKYGDIVVVNFTDNKVDCTAEYLNKYCSLIIDFSRGIINLVKGCIITRNGKSEYYLNSKKTFELFKPDSIKDAINNMCALIAKDISDIREEYLRKANTSDLEILHKGHHE